VRLRSTRGATGLAALTRYELLVALAEDPERVFRKEELLRMSCSSDAVRD
jgi:DNA-binding response OmpR family regulator